MENSLSSVCLCSDFLWLRYTLQDNLTHRSELKPELFPGFELLLSNRHCLCMQLADSIRLTAVDLSGSVKAIIECCRLTSVRYFQVHKNWKIILYRCVWWVRRDKVQRVSRWRNVANSLQAWCLHRLILCYQNCSHRDRDGRSLKLITRLRLQPKSKTRGVIPPLSIIKTEVYCSLLIWIVPHREHSALLLWRQRCTPYTEILSVFCNKTEFRLSIDIKRNTVVTS